MTNLTAKVKMSLMRDCDIMCKYDIVQDLTHVELCMDRWKIWYCYKSKYWILHEL